jgi:hypothetical protein
MAGGFPSLASAQDVAVKQQVKQGLSYKEAYVTTMDYVVQFYPLWFTYYQSQFASVNQLVGPERISPFYRMMVVINNDTLYASTFLIHP